MSVAYIVDSGHDEPAYELHVSCNKIETLREEGLNSRHRSINWTQLKGREDFVVGPSQVKRVAGVT
jgi:uncharacterized cysteine cluster protein YcgN (CxxCxxCC family)